MNSSDLLGPQGPFAVCEGYEYRPAQLHMAQIVEDVLAHKGIAFVEAGTGTGKTLGYLVPALLSHKRVIVSTGTKTLQDQIMQNELPRIEQTLGIETNAVCMKGLSNYVCLRKFHEFSQVATAGSAFENDMKLITQWVEGSHTGDHSELSSLPENSEVFPHVTSSSETRIGPSCIFHDQCFVTRLKSAAQAAQLIVVNHHLFFANLAMGGHQINSIIPPYDAVIFDEAHQIEDVMTQYFGTHISMRRVDLLCHEIRKTFALTESFPGVERVLSQVHFCTREFFQEIVNSGLGYMGRFSLTRSVVSSTKSIRYKLDTVLDDLENECKLYLKTEASMSPLIRRIRKLRDDFGVLDEENISAHILWAECKNSNAEIGASPIEVSDIFRSRVLDVTPSVICTSATLSAGSSFEFIKQRLGVDRQIDENIFNSPFDYEQQSVLFVAEHLPDCREAAFNAAAVVEIAKLIELSQGGAFVLCTSLKSVKELSDSYKAMTEKPVFVQDDAPKAVLLKKFKEDKNGVLFGSGTFWEGVDVPGKALRMVIIDKLPFDVPTDPLVKARCRRLEEQNQSPFARYQLPSAALTLKQGFGRLIRSKDDYGAVAVLDRRLVTKGYGKVLLRNLPLTRHITDWDELRSAWNQLGHGRKAPNPI